MLQLYKRTANLSNAIFLRQPFPKKCTHDHPPVHAQSPQNICFCQVSIETHHHQSGFKEDQQNHQ